MTIRHRLRSVGLAAVFLAGSMAAATLLTSPASAAVHVDANGQHQQTVKTVKITATRTAAPGSAAAKALPADAPPSITCWTNYTAAFIIDPGGLNLIAANAITYCSYPVDELDLCDLLLWNYVNTFGYDGQSAVLSSAVSAAPTDQCVSGVFQSQVNVRIIFPPGYSGSGSDTFTTPPQWYDC
jgi:hypothetical protein